MTEKGCWWWTPVRPPEAGEGAGDSDADHVEPLAGAPVWHNCTSTHRHSPRARSYDKHTRPAVVRAQAGPRPPEEGAAGAERELSEEGAAGAEHERWESSRRACGEVDHHELAAVFGGEYEGAAGSCQEVELLARGHGGARMDETGEEGVAGRR